MRRVLDMNNFCSKRRRCFFQCRDPHAKNIYSSDSYIEFGAHQCILVRNEAALKKLREEVGDIGMIM